MRARNILAVALVVGVAFGLSQHLDGTPRVVVFILALGAPWLVAALWIATASRSLMVAIVAAAVMLGSGTLVHYLAMKFRGGGHGYVLEMALVWGAGSVVAGVAVGVLAFSASRYRWTISGSLLLGEAAVLASEWTHNPAQIVVAAEAIVGAVLIARSVRVMGVRVLVAALAVAVAVFAGESLLREFAKSSGWRGA